MATQGNSISLSATWAIQLRELRFMHPLAYGEFMGENWAAFCPPCKGRMPPNLQEKNGQHFVLLLYRIYPKKYSSLSLNYGTLLASHSAVPRPFRLFQCIFAPPPDICLRSMGRCRLLLCPSPGSLRDLRVWGGWRLKKVD